MSSPKTTNTPVRRLISILVMLVLLGIFLRFYYFKYVPQKKSDYNGRAFTELKSVTDAFSDRDAACQQVARWLYDQQPDSVWLGPDNTGKWDIVYRLASPYKPQRRNLDSLLHLLTDGDRDVFDNYLMILQNAAPPSPHSKDTPPAHKEKAEIVFNSGDLSMDYQVDMDSLLKKSDGFSTMNMYDVRIEGNDYKLFLYPFPFHGQRTIMAGLVGLSHYTSRYESAPIDLITTGSILLLLLLVAIPLLKIYIIGSHERITTFDLRMIIGSYFIGGLVLFFLFAWNFLGSVQNANNRIALKGLARQLETNFCGEIDTACRQLRAYDKLYHNNGHIHSLLSQKHADSAEMKGITEMHPRLYRQFDDVFWINSSGKWVARWGFKEYEALPLIHVSDRQYFQNMKAGDVLLLKKYNDTFCLDPTLGKLDGKFVNNIVIRSQSNSTSPDSPIMLGLSGDMYSVCNTVLPPGYGFSIIDRSGKILFNSQMNRSLLSSIYTEFEDPAAIEQYIRYRQERYFGSLPLHGQQVAMLVTPIRRLPFTVIVYTALDTDQRFQLHILSLTSFFIGCIILLLILSAYFNEWARTKPSLVAIAPINFEWLRPVPAKAGYYRYLQWGMVSLAACYAIAWFFVECIYHKHEFYLLSLSMLLPFYMAIFYFVLREKQKVLKNPDSESRGPWAGLYIPALAICTITIYLLCIDPRSWNSWLAIGTQLLFIGLIWLLQHLFTKDANTIDPDKMLPRFIRAVVTGILTVVIIPAMGLFCFFFKEETRTRNKQENLAMATAMCARKDAIIKDKSDYSFYKHDIADSVFLTGLKFTKGVYLPDSTGASEPDISATSISAHTPEMYYRLRNFLFSGDTTALTFGSNPQWASDSSWYFAREGDSEVLRHDASWNRDSTRVKLALAHNTRLTALELLRRNVKNLSPANILLFILTVIVLLALFCRLTSSLATRIFLLRVFRSYPKEICKNDIFAEVDPSIPGLTEWFPAAIRQYEEEDPGYRIMYVQAQLKDVYQKIWATLSPREKFVAYDFAIDSLANYKAGLPLYNLIRKGVLCVDDDEQLRFITHSFHNYILNQSGNKVIVAQLKKAREQGSWQTFRMPLFLILSGAGIFVFLTQEDTYQKITGLLTSIGSLLPLISQFFNKSDK